MDKKTSLTIGIIAILAVVFVSGCIGNQTKTISFDGFYFETIHGFDGESSQPGKSAILNDGFTSLKVITDNTEGKINTDPISDNETRDNLTVNTVNYLYSSIPEDSNNSTTIRIFFTKDNMGYGIIAFVSSEQYNSPGYMVSFNETIQHILSSMRNNN